MVLQSQGGRGAPERASRGARRVQARRGGKVRGGFRRGGAGGPEALVEGGVEVLALVPARPNLEEMFLRLTEDE